MAVAEETSLPFFAEVGEAKACGRLILAFASHAGHHQNDQGYHVRDHLVKLLIFHVLHSGGNVEIQDVESTKQEGCQNADIRTSDRKDDQCDGKPASVSEGVV